MSQSREAAPTTDADLDVGTRPDYDSWYASMASGVYHFLLIILIGIIADVSRPRDRLAPAVDTVAVAVTDSSGGESSDDPAGERMQASAERAQSSPSTPASQEAIAEVKPIETPDVEIAIDVARADIGKKVEQARASAAQAKAAAAKTLNDNLGGSPGGGGGTGTGRAGRAARWILRLNTASTTDHLAQLGGLGAEVAFPQRGNNYLYFSNLGGSPRSSAKDLAQEKRIYWMDENGQSITAIASHLGVRPPPVIMIAFLPIELEDRMVKLEKAYKGAEEDRILQTVFECVRSGGGYDVVVVDQTTR